MRSVLIFSLPVLLFAGDAEAAPLKSVAIVCAGEQPVYRTTIDGFKSKLKILNSEARTHEYASAAEATAANVDLIFVVGTSAVRAISQLTVKAPVLYALAGDSAAAGLQGRVGGVATAVSPSARIELIAAIAPDVRRIGIVSGLGSPYAQELETRARAAGLTSLRIEVRSAEDVGPALIAAEGELDAILAVSDPAIWNAASLKASVILSLQKRKPLFGFSTMFTRGGAVASIAGEDPGDVGAQAAEQAQAIFTGAGAPAIAYPRNTSISINLVVARRLGLEPSRAAIERATTVLR
jgi:ABC-type uncharacterized transport system substrate-binding protein